MEGKSVSRFLKISPRKVRLVIDLVRNQDADYAVALLTHVPKGAAPIVKKAILSALASVRRNPAHKGPLVISKITANEGPTKTGRRWRAAAMGRGVRYRRRQTHLVVELEAK